MGVHLFLDLVPTALQRLAQGVPRVLFLEKQYTIFWLFCKFSLVELAHRPRIDLLLVGTGK